MMMLPEQQDLRNIHLLHQLTWHFHLQLVSRASGVPESQRKQLIKQTRDLTLTSTLKLTHTYKTNRVKQRTEVMLWLALAQDRRTRTSAHSNFSST